MRRFGIQLRDAAAQLQGAVSYPAEKTQPLPAPNGVAPYRAKPAGLGIADPADTLELHVIGDHGGVSNPTPQLHVAAAMAADHARSPVDLCYSVGDIGYFFGENSVYPPQFAEPYAHYNVPIVGIPGNHDGDTSDNPFGARKPLDGFMAHFCSPAPVLLPGEEEYQRDTQTQPNCYWSLAAELVTVIGLYTNVPSGGVIEADQAAWLESELAAAAADRPVIVTLHHPPYSCDAHHGGSASIGAVIDTAAVAAKRWPDLVLSGHVHSYQRFTRTVAGKFIPYVVCGASGYPNLHSMASGIGSLPWAAGAGVSLDAYQDKLYGFLRLAVIGGTITGSYTTVSKTGAVTPDADSFTVAA